MIRLPFAQDKQYGVVGLGKSGRATVASLLASGAKVVAWDDKEATRASVQKEFPAIMLQPVERWDYTALASLVMSPGIFLNHPAVLAAQAHGLEVIGDIELLYRAQRDANALYIAITGTNGKSTTTTLIAHILKACGIRVEVGGNLGTPALALAPIGSEGVYVLELSSYQLDLLKTARFEVAILLNISPDHLDHHGSMEAYIAAKKHIFDRQNPEDIAIIGADDPHSIALMASLRAESPHPTLYAISSTHSTDRGVDVQHGILYDRSYDKQGDITTIRSLQGEHNWQNAAAAYAACRACNIPHEVIMEAMHSYPGLAHRMEWLGEVNGVQFVNDSKATNADAAEKALKTYDDIYWIIGGVAKEGGIEPLANYFSKIRHAYLIGEAAADFAKTLDGKVAFTDCGTLDNAFYAAAHAAQKEGAPKASVVLSPACASFDQFPNFEVRGEAFVKLFQALQQGGTHAATT